MTARETQQTGDLARRLSEAEATIAALLSGQIDAVVDPTSNTPVLLFQAQAALRDSEERLRLERNRAQQYLDTAEVILLALDLKGRITLVNRFACSILGWTAGELLGRDFIEICVPARIRDETRTKLGGVIAGPDSSIVNNAIVTSSGEERMIEWRNTLLRDHEGRVVSTLSSGTDLTERNRAVEELRAAEERMRFALEAAGVGIWDMDYTTRELRWSETLEAHYGLKPGTFDGTFEGFLERVHPDDRASVVESVEEATKSGADFSIQNRSIWPDGTVRWLSGAGRVHLGGHGEPLRAIGITQDVTERRTLEGQYQQAQKMEAVGRLASGVAHDFNNLLTVILGFAELVAADVAKPNQHVEELGEIIKAAQRATALTKQLLAFSRQQVLHTVPLDVNGLITDMTGMLGRLIGEDIAVTLALSPGLSLALADRSQLEQVVMNLVVNARDAMPGGGKVTIETMDIELESSPFQEGVITPGQYVMLAVTDTGSGMTKETQRRLFEPFFTTKEAGKGTGLGLSTTYGIVKQSRGYIWVYSELGKGTTFKVYLPRSTGTAALLAVSNPVLAAPPKRALETVLLVEDEAGVRQLSKRILANAGYRVLEAESGTEAERLFAEHSDSIDLVVTDVVMPGCGGPELISRLRVRAPSVRVLYMSGYTEQSAANKAGLDQGFPFVQKPFKAAEFVRLVRDTLDRDLAPDAAAPPVAAGPSPRGTETLLVVDDEPSVRHLARGVLQAQGYEVLSAANGQDALHVARDHRGSPIRLVVTDVIMPIMGGKVMVEWLKTTYPNLKILFTSGYTDEAITQSGALEPEVEFLAKPYTPAALTQRVRQMLDTPLPDPTYA
jgi:two-component system cell cycle sensor histidine kinase/response regulator CckA